MRLRFCLFLFLTTVCTSAAWSAPLRVVTATYAADGAKIQSYLFRPDGPGPFPAIVALHGCGGLFRRNGGLTSRHADWAERFRKAGYVVLFPDSFGSRGHKSLCKIKKRPVKHSDRVGDLRGAADWLAEQPFVDPARMALLGWSNGGSSLLRALAPEAAPQKSDFLTAIAFYPSCRWALNRAQWQPRLQPIIFMGAADDWTPPGPCKALAEKWGYRLVLYEGAYHGFDAPDSKPRVLTGRAFSANGDGVVHVGTHPKARQDAIRDVMAHLKAVFGK